VRHVIAALVLALVATVVPSWPAAAAAAEESCPAASGGSLPSLPDLDAEIVFRGRGFGHGTGMSQYGAYGAAQLGCSHRDILSTYYPGTTFSARASEPLRLSLNEASIKVTVRAESADVRWQRCSASGSGCSYVHVQPKGETWTARVVQSSATATAAIRIEKLVDGSWQLVEQHPEDAIIRVVLESVNRDAVGPVATVDDGARSRQLARGVIEIDTTENGTDRAFVTLLIGMEQYLYGISEVASLWPTETLRAQAVAARSYAYSRIDARVAQHGAKGDPRCRCHLYSSTVDQNYWGYGKESEALSNGSNVGDRWVAAVRDTSSVILTYDGVAIPAFYASIHGGSSESYAFWGGSSERPYLVAVDDSAWEVAAAADLSSWALGVSAKTLGSVLGVGVVTDVTTPGLKGARGRVGIPTRYGGVVVTGTAGEWRGSGVQLRRALTVLGPDCGSRSAQGAVARLCSSSFIVDVNLGPQPVRPPAGAIRIAGDWNGDGIDTPGWFKDGKWGLHSRLSGSGGTTQLSYGKPGDLPVVGDWDGDGVDTVGVVRDGNLWILRNEYVKDAKDIVLRYGERGDVPVTGDWDGNGTDTLGVVRGNLWILRNRYVKGAKDTVLAYGDASDTKVTGDWDGNGTDTLGVVRDNLWILRNRYAKSAKDIVLEYGNGSDLKLTGDWDGNGTDTLGVVRGTTWIVRDQYIRSAADTSFSY
jgi:peptidoglycan hydrolase-like amidase